MTAELVCAATDPEWLERRREGITATDIVTIAGLVTWDSPWALYHRKLGLLPEVEETWRMRRGSWLEGALADEWRMRRGWLGKDAELSEGGLVRSTVRPWQMATLDRALAYNQEPLECKSTQQRQGWGPDGTDQVPAHVRAQVLWQMDTLGVATGHVAADVCGDFRSYTIRHSTQGHCELAPDRPCQDIGVCTACMEIDGLRDLGLGFMYRLQNKTPPDLDGLEVTTDALRYLHPAPGGAAVIDQELVKVYDDAVIAKKFGEAIYHKAQNEVRDAMGNAEAAATENGGRVVFRRTVGKRAGYEVPPGETDILRRIGKDKD